MAVAPQPRSTRPAPPPWPAGRPLRAWQEEAVAKVMDHSGPSFLASATPAAGKTTFGLHIAHRMLSEGRVARVAIVAPTTHICRQWAADAARYGLDVEPNRPNAAGPEPRDRSGIAVTYQTVAAGPGVHRRRASEAPTLLIADEPHHMGEQAAWGRSTVTAFAGARFRLLLSGTPFRSAAARRTREPHRAVHSRVNRATGAASVSSASVEQLEKGNRLLEREVSRGRR